MCQACFEAHIARWPQSPQRMYAQRLPDEPPHHLQTFLRDDKKITVNTRFFHAGATLPFRSSTSPVLLKVGNALAEEARTIVDVGANVGELTVHWASRARRCWSLEPIPATFEILEKNVTQNELEERVIPLQVAAYSDAAPRRMKYSERQAETASISDRGDVEVECVTLDSLDLTEVDLVKIDVEGQELEVLRGAERLLRRDQPHLIIEYNPKFEYDYIDLREELMKYGYGRPKPITRNDLLFHRPT